MAVFLTILWVFAVVFLLLFSASADLKLWEAIQVSFGVPTIFLVLVVLLYSGLSFFI